jgi:hypothetical protein
MPEGNRSPVPRETILVLVQINPTANSLLGFIVADVPIAGLEFFGTQLAPAIAVLANEM